MLDKLNLSKTSLPAEINLKTIKGIAREYFFLKGKKVKAIALKRKAALQKLWRALHDSVQPTLNYLPLLLEPYLFASFNPRTQHALIQLAKKAQALLTFAYDRCFDQHSEKACRFYSLHLDQVSCFNKGKLKRELEFGRQFQIGRLQGNFVWSTPNNSIRMPDAESLTPMVRAHLQLFQTIPKSIATDKGYYAKNNERFMLDLGIDHVGLQRCNRVYADPPDNPIDQEQQQALINRRAGIEPIIGHLKQNWQMGRSRMKSDRTTESAGFCALLGFNLRQLTRYLTGETKPVASL